MKRSFIKKPVKAASFMGYNYRYEVHWMVPPKGDVLLGGSHTLEGAADIAVNQMNQVMENPWETDERRYSRFETLCVVDSETGEDVTDQAFPGGDTHGLSIEDLADGYMSELEGRMKHSSVTSSKSTTASINIPSGYNEYYHIGTQEDVDNWGIEGTIASNVEEIQSMLHDGGYADYDCIGIAFANDEYYDALSDDGLDVLYITDDSLSPMCLWAGDSLIPVSIYEIERLTEDDDIVY